MNKKNTQADLAALFAGDAGKDTDARFALAEQLNKMLGERLEREQSAVSDKPPKVIRDSFTMPEDDYQLIQKVQERALDFRMHATKGEVLRAGLHALENLSNAELMAVLKGVEKLKPGRRKGG